jgi:hypothetical protein
VHWSKPAFPSISTRCTISDSSSQVADVDDDALVYWSGIEFVEPSEHVSLAIAEFLSSVR